MKQILFFILLFGNAAWAKPQYTNALIKEHSPHLQQHAHNPVNWYPWGEAAFTKAKKEHKLIFLSIGYSTCHWCHVMEEESFTDLEVAKLLNDDFISIKVDREQYPQIDKKYQKLYTKVYGKRGGWPLSVFMTAQKEVFFIGTYIPKEEAYGSEGLLRLLPSFVTLSKSKQAMSKAIEKHKKQIQSKTLHLPQSTKLIDRMMLALSKQFDVKNGGFAKRPKFPEASKIALLLDIYALNGNKKALSMTEQTLQKMAKSGIYDQIHGGFFRYTVDEAWQTPHFEKMLYTNAELIAVYTKAYIMTEEKLYKRVVEESIAQMEEHYMQGNVYLSASDADSEGEEGGYFIYEYLALKSTLKYKGWKAKEIEDALAYLGIEEDGNIDGELSQPHITTDVVPPRVEELKAYLRKVSSKRSFPFVDKKVNTAWNAMMIKSLFEASKIDKKYLVLAQKRLAALLALMRPKEILYHQTLIGKVPTQKALLEDYAFLVDALITGYERNYDEGYLKLAQLLTDEAVSKFYRDKHWYLSDDGIGAYADFDDRYYTAALSVMLDNLVRMASLTDNLKYNTVVKESIEHTGAVLQSNPTSASKLVDTFLHLEKGDVIIHATKQKLLMAQKEIERIAYPFVLSKVQESDAYLACKTTMCFAYDKNITKLIENIKKAVQ